MIDPIATIEVGTARLDLPAPIRIASGEIRSREYAAVRVTTEQGLSGCAYCLTREAPVAACVHRLVAPALIGCDSADPESAWRRASRATIMPGRVGLVVRAVGLVDIALWDIAARRQGVPLWKLLGAEHSRLAVMSVAAYPTPDRTPKSLAGDVLRNAAAGHRLVKIARDPDPARMAQLLDALKTPLPAGTGLVIDAGYAWTDAASAVAEVALWDAPKLAWLEDPLVPEDIEGYRTLSGALGQRIGAGDELSSMAVYRDLLREAVLDVLRLDLVCIGGVTPAREVLQLAERHGVEVSFHVYPEMSAHVAAASEALIESFERDLPGGNPLDPADRLISGGPVFAGGSAELGDRPGLGFELDWEQFSMSPSPMR